MSEVTIEAVAFHDGTNWTVEAIDCFNVVVANELFDGIVRLRDEISDGGPFLLHSSRPAIHSFYQEILDKSGYIVSYGFLRVHVRSSLKPRKKAGGRPRKAREVAHAEAV